MSLGLLERPAGVGTSAGPDNGGVPARRAMVRWAWRLFRREWRQQFLILSLIIVAVAATFVGATVAINTPPPANAGFGTAHNLVSLQGTPSQLLGELAQVQSSVGRSDIIANQALAVPGSINTFDLRSQNPAGAYGRPMLSLVSGHYPSGPGQAAMTSGLLSSLNLRVGDTWHEGGHSRQIVGVVQNPQSLLDEFALVAPGQVTAPTQVTVLFDAHGALPAIKGGNFQVAGASANTNAFNPETIVLALATLGMLLIALVSIGGFTVLAQRRMRSIGMLGSLGATDKNIRLVVRANGLVVGVVGTLIGAALGLAAWLAYRPHAEASSHHLIAEFALPWTVIGISMALAVVATFLAATRPANSVTKVPIVVALSGRPAPPRQVRRTAVPGVIAMVIAFFLVGAAASNGGHGGGAPQLVLGLVILIVAVVLLSPFFLTLLARLTRGAPISIRLAVRDLARYRARSGSALAAISLGVLIAVIVCVVAASRYGNVLDYAGPNMGSNQLIVYTPNGGPGGGGPGGGQPVVSGTPASMQHAVDTLAASLGTRDVVELDSTSANLQHDGPGRQFNGQVYVATPQLLRSFGISASSINPNADILSMRSGFSTISNMQLTWNSGKGGGQQYIGPGGGPGGSQTTSYPCPRNACLANPVIQEVSALPSGTSAPNTVITEHAIHQFDLQTSPSGWLIQIAQPLTATQLTSARLAAAAAGMSIETKNDQPSSSEITTWATVFGIALALGILAMTIGLIRSETASDLRILAATGASSTTRRSLTAATAGALALLGAVVGTVAGYVATLGYASGSQLDGLSSLANIPLRNLLLIVVAMPLVAAGGAWLLAGRQPPSMAQQPME